MAIYFGSRIRDARKRANLTQKELAARLGVSNTSISNWEKDISRPGPDMISNICGILEIAPNELFGNVSSEPQETSQQTMIPPGFEPLPKMVKVPLVGSIACGEPITAEENIEGYVDAPENVRCDFALTCKGDSMIDAGISDGDVVYIRSQPEVENGEIAAVRLDGEATLKRVYLDGDQLTLMPANAKYPPKTYSGFALEEICIEGKAVAFTHWFEKG